MGEASFSSCLKEVEQRFEACDSSQVDDLETTIACLQKIKRSLEETDEYRAASAEKERAFKKSRVQVLQETVNNSEKEITQLLGFRPVFEQFNQTFYSMLPKGCISKEYFATRVGEIQGYIAKNTADLKRVQDEKKHCADYHYCADYYAGYGAHIGKRAVPNHDQIEAQISSFMMQIETNKSSLLTFVMSNKPVDATAFHDKLAPHLDSMLDALLELRSLEMGTLDDVAKK